MSTPSDRIASFHQYVEEKGKRQYFKETFSDGIKDERILCNQFISRYNSWNVSGYPFMTNSNNPVYVSPGLISLRNEIGINSPRFTGVERRGVIGSALDLGFSTGSFLKDTITGAGRSKPDFDPLEGNLPFNFNKEFAIGEVLLKLSVLHPTKIIPIPGMFFHHYLEQYFVCVSTTFEGCVLWESSFTLEKKQVFMLLCCISALMDSPEIGICSEFDVSTGVGHCMGLSEIIRAVKDKKRICYRNLPPTDRPCYFLNSNFRG